MKRNEDKIKISTNLKAVESLKSEILSEIADLYRKLSVYDEDNSYDEAVEAISTVISMNYILARRLGISYSVIDDRMIRFLSIAEESGHELELEFSDMSHLKKYIKSVR